MQTRSLVFFVAASSSAALTAQASWSLLYPTNPPAARSLPTFAMHEASGKAVLLFGWDVAGAPANQQLVLTGNAWAVQTGPLPPWRVEAMVAFDAVRNEVVMFGGNNPGVTVFDDTWRWNGATWSQAVTSVRPSARHVGAMAFDRERGVVVLFGGLGAGSPAVWLGDTWEWNGTTWQPRVVSPAPAPRLRPGFAFDPVSRGVMLHGGEGPLGSSAYTIYADTWIWNGSAWTQRQPQLAPPFRVGAGMVCDLDRQRVVLLGGNGADPFTWEWDGADWQVSYQATPWHRTDFGIGYDANMRRVVLHGGRVPLYGTGYYQNDTWMYRTPQPADVALFGSGCAGTIGTPALAAAPFSLPWLGDTAQLVVDAIPATEPGAVFVSSFGSIPPIPLVGVGMPGCDLLVPTDVVEFRAATAGRAEWQLAIPNAPALAGVQFRQQAFVLDAAANALGLVASNGVTATLGVR